jgi:putative transposase
MLRGNRFRIYPKKDQKIILEKHFGSCRFVYNKLLNIKQIFYEKFRATISKSELEKHLVVLKEIFPFLNEVNSQSLQQTNKDLDNAFKKFFSGLGGYPKKKSKKFHHCSFQVPQDYKINLSTSELFLPKIGWIKVKFHRNLVDPSLFSGIIKHRDNSETFRTLTISKTPTGKYYVSILTDNFVDNSPR